MLPNALVLRNRYLLTAFDIAGQLTFWKREKIFVRFSSCWGILIWKQHRCICTSPTDICIPSLTRWRPSRFPHSIPLNGPVERRKNEPAAVEVADILRAQGNSFIDRHRGWLRF